MENIWQDKGKKQHIKPKKLKTKDLKEKNDLLKISLLLYITENHYCSPSRHSQTALRSV